MKDTNTTKGIVVTQNELKRVAAQWESEIMDMQLGLITLDAQTKELVSAQKRSEIGIRLESVRRNRREMKKRIEQKRSEMIGLQKAIATLGKEIATPTGSTDDTTSPNVSVFPTEPKKVKNG